MSPFEMGALMVLATACYVVAHILIEMYGRRARRLDGYREMDRFAAKGVQPDDGPRTPSVERTPPRIESSFDDNERIGKL